METVTIYKMQEMKRRIMCVLTYAELYIVLLRIVSSSSVYSTTNLGIEEFTDFFSSL